MVGNVEGGPYSAANRSAIWGQSLPADHFKRALYKRSAKGLPQAIKVCQKKICIWIYLEYNNTA